MTLTADRQLELGGVLVGGDDGTYHVVSFDPWRAPTLDIGDSPRPRRHGIAPGFDLGRVRLIPVAILVTADTKPAAHQAMHDLRGAWAPTDSVVELSWRDGGRIYSVLGRPRGVDSFTDIDRDGADILVECRFEALDPRIYGELVSLSTPFPTGEGLGLEFDLEFDVDFGGPVIGGSVQAVNAGTFPAPWRIRIDGPVSDPIVIHDNTGDSIEVGMELGAGQHLILDSAERAVLLNGTSNAYPNVVGIPDWFDLEPGPNTVRYSGFDGTGSTMQITYRPAWY